MVVICLLGFLGWVGFAIISEGDERQKKQQAHRGRLKNQEIGFFFFQVDTTAADGLHGPSTNRGEEVKAFSAF